VELSIGAVRHLLAQEKNETDGTWQARVPWIPEAGGRHVHKVAGVRAACARWSCPRPASKCPAGVWP
jgi:hypothetical protein